MVQLKEKLNNLLAIQGHIQEVEKNTIGYS